MTQADNQRPVPEYSPKGVDGPFKQLSIPEDVMPTVEAKPWSWPALGRAAVRPPHEQNPPSRTHDSLDRLPHPDELNFPAIKPLITEGAAWAEGMPEEFAPATTEDLRAVYQEANAFLDQAPVRDTQGSYARVKADPANRRDQGLVKETIRGRTVWLRTPDGRPVKIDQTTIVAPYPRAPHGTRITFQLNKDEQLVSTVLPPPTTEAEPPREPVAGGIDSHVTAQYILDDLHGAIPISEEDYKRLERNTLQKNRPGSAYDNGDTAARKFMPRRAADWQQQAILRHVRAQNQEAA